MAIKKSELYGSLWKSCDELRGGMDASQYKDYVLAFLFVKYISDKYDGKPDPKIEVPKGGSFSDMVAAKNDKDIGDKINKIIGRLTEANKLKGVIQADFNDENKLGKGKEMVDRLTNLVSIFQNPDLDFSKNRADGDDLLGDAYEYLVRHFATESGKSKGQFYTPAEVSRVIAKVVGVRNATSQDQTLYDPTCGSGSLLLKAADEAPYGITIYGQEKDLSTAGLARMNMILHNKPEAEIWQDNTLSAPHFKNRDNIGLKTFDFVVANPPFSDKAWSNGLDPAEDEYRRFEDGVPPAKNGDYAYLLHILASMKSTGKGAMILPHGVLFRGNAEGDIRRNLIRKGVIKGIIGLPPNLFYGTGIPACILVLDKENASSRRGIFMIDASKGFMKDGNKNRLRHQDIRKIVDVFNGQIALDRYSRMVPVAEIEANDYNLNIPRYIDSTEPEDLQDIEAHLKGGIPERDVEGLSAYWAVCPTLKDKLFSPASRPGYCTLRVEAAEIKKTIHSNPEFRDYTHRLKKLFDDWMTHNKPMLKGIEAGENPKDLIMAISEDLLSVFSDVPLIDRYDIYQYLMTYWDDVMQDDVYLITSDGWKGANTLTEIIKKKGEKSDEEPDIAIGKAKFKADLIPPALIVVRYFGAEKAALDDLQAGLEAVSQEMAGMQEEHGGDEGLLAAVIGDNDKIAKGAVKARLKGIKGDRDSDDEREVLEQYLGLIDRESEAKKAVKAAEEALNKKLLKKYPALTEDEIKTLVVEDKWAASLCSDIRVELDRLSQHLTGRIRDLADRYETPLPEIEDEVEALGAKVDEHLKRMGFAWQ
jgi:type I restriction enzyme M protein